MANSWSGHPNGQIPYELMLQVHAPITPGGPEVATGKFMQPDAALALMRLIRAGNAAGHEFYIAPGEDLYRDLDRQRFWKDYWTAHGEPGKAAAVGTSNHGWGLAADVQGWNTVAALAWLTANSRAYGYLLHTVPSEQWHWLYIGGTTTTAGEASDLIPDDVPKIYLPQEDDMHPSFVTDVNGKGWYRLDGDLLVLRTRNADRATRWIRKYGFPTATGGAPENFDTISVPQWDALDAAATARGAKTVDLD
jgi:hypothetical protein